MSTGTADQAGRAPAQSGSYMHSMFLDDDAPIAGGREIWGLSEETGV